MGGGLERRCVGRVYDADGAMRTAPSLLPYCIKLRFHIIS